jgi:hypothetical protein
MLDAFRARQTTELHLGHPPLSAFLSGYRLGLVVAGLLVCSGGIAAWLALRNLPSNQPATNRRPPIPASQTMIAITQ